jgi:lipid-binding SYLF domain-containing protein
MIRTACVPAVLALAMGVFGLATTGCSTAPKSDSARAALNTESRATVSAFMDRDRSLRTLMDQSVGYAVFPSVGKAGFIGGGAYGRGEVFERGMFAGYADITQGSVGLQIGAQSYDELIVFLTQDQLDKFRRNQFAFSANASAVALAEGAAAAADHSQGVIVVVRPQGGLMAEASIGGQEFTFQPAGSAESNERGYATGRE